VSDHVHAHLHESVRGYVLCDCRDYVHACGCHACGYAFSLSFLRYGGGDHDHDYLYVLHECGHVCPLDGHGRDRDHHENGRDFHAYVLSFILLLHFHVYAHDRDRDRGRDHDVHGYGHRGCAIS